MKLPLVSTIITSYNYGRYILDALQSVKNQTYRPIECIVIDDFSTDDSVDKINSFIQQNPPSETLSFRLLRNQENLGQLASFARGIQNSKGIFLNFLDADDVLYPEFINTHIQVLMNANVGMSVSEQTIINENSELTSMTEEDPALVFRNFFPLYDTLDSEDFRNMIITGNIPADNNQYPLYTVNKKYLFGMWYWAPTSNVMFRRGILDTFEYSSEYEKWRICADRLLYNLVHYIAGSCHINRRLAAYRRHGRNGFYMRKSMGKSTYTPKRMKNLCGSCNMTGHSLFSIFKMTKEKKGSLDNQFLSEFVLFILPALSLFYIVSHISLWFSLLNKGNITTWIGIGILPPRWIWIRIKKLLLKLFGKLS